MFTFKVNNAHRRSCCVVRKYELFDTAIRLNELQWDKQSLWPNYSKQMKPSFHCIQLLVLHSYCFQDSKNYFHFKMKYEYNWNKWLIVLILLCFPFGNGSEFPFEFQMRREFCPFENGKKMKIKCPVFKRCIFALFVQTIQCILMN